MKTAPSLFQIRLRAPHTANDAQWAATFRALSENRGACDEVWFSTGISFPPMAWHREHAARLARYAADLRRVGIEPSLQFQATLGHGDSFSGTPEEMAGRTWSGFTGPTGVECKACNCPRQPAFLAYVREMARLYATAIRPAWLWIDDDLRVNNHRPAVSGAEIGCWCPTCRAAFAARHEMTGEAEPRNDGAADAVNDGGALRQMTNNWESTLSSLPPEAARHCGKAASHCTEGAPSLPLQRPVVVGGVDAADWERFSFSSIAAVAAAIAEETRAVSPETRFGYQHAPWPNDLQLTVFRALREAGGGRPVGSRPGGGHYYDLDPHDPVKKALASARQRRVLGDPEWIDTWLPEIETFPRAFASRTARGILLEALASLAYGMNGLSALIMDTRYETDDWYSENILAPLAAERDFLEGYRDAILGTVPAGLDVSSDLPLDGVYAYALAGIPVVPGPGRTLGAMTAEDAALKICSCSSRELLRLRAEADGRSAGRLHVVVDEPSVGLVVPRVTPDGALRTVMLLNARIEAQKPLTLRLRASAGGAGGAAPRPLQALWHTLGEPSAALPLCPDGTDVLVTIPDLSPWSAGWLNISPSA